MARRAVTQELSRERILEEARELFSSYGYRTLTMRSIAKALGYSHGALYYHFKEKAELFYALIVDDFNMLLQRQRRLIREAEGYNIELVEQLMLEFIRFGIEYPHHYEIMFMIHDEEILQYSRREQAKCLDLFAGVIRKVLGQEAGTQEGERSFTLPWNLFMSIHGFITCCIQYGQTFEEAYPLAKEHVGLLLSNFPLNKEHHPSMKLLGHESA